MNEITVIPRNYDIIIDKENKDIKYVKIDFNEDTISLNSQNGMDTLDEWFERWVSIVRVIRKKSDNVRFDLSGGFDSRAVSSIWFSANMNPDRTFINSIQNNNKKRFRQDYEIASKIADEMGFQLNINKFKEKRIFFKDIHTPILLSFYTKLGFHKEMYNSKYKFVNPVYIMGGLGGESIRGYYKKTPREFIDNKINFLKDKGETVCISAKNEFTSTFNKLIDDFPSLNWDSTELSEKIYIEVRSRYHFGRKMCEDYNRNIYNLSPLMDPLLHKLQLTTDECNDRDLLLALIYVRYCPKLLDFDFEGNRVIDKETINHAIMINEKYPYLKKQYDYIEKPEVKPERIKENKKSKKSKKSPKKVKKQLKGIKSYIKDIFNSRSFRKEFEKYYPSKFYKIIYNQLNDEKIPSHANVFSAMAILNSINYTQEDSMNLDSWIKSFLKSPVIEDSEIGINNEESLKIYETARIDIVKKSEDDNELEILENNDEYSIVEYFTEFQKEDETGLSITSSKNGLNLKLKCIGAGKMFIYLGSIKICDKNGNSFPVFIDYKKLTINGEELLEKNMLLCYEDQYCLEINVDDSQVIDIRVEWSPFTKESEYEDKLKIVKKDFESLNNKLNNVNELNNRLNKENEQLRVKNAQIVAENEKLRVNSVRSNMENEELRGKNIKINMENEEITKKYHSLYELNQSILNSTSWRLTEPLRNLKSKFKNIFSR